MSTYIFVRKGDLCLTKLKKKKNKKMKKFLSYIFIINFASKKNLER